MKGFDHFSWIAPWYDRHAHVKAPRDLLRLLEMPPGGRFLDTGGGTGYGLQIAADSSSPVRAALRIVPQDTQPSGPNLAGDIYVTTAGVLKICTVDGTPGTWVSVGSQT